MRARYKVKLRSKTTGAEQTVYTGMSKEAVKSSMDLLMDFGDVNEPKEIVIEPYFEQTPQSAPAKKEGK